MVGIGAPFLKPKLHLAKRIGEKKRKKNKERRVESTKPEVGEHESEINKLRP